MIKICILLILNFYSGFEDVHIIPVHMCTNEMNVSEQECKKLE